MQTLRDAGLTIKADDQLETLRVAGPITEALAATIRLFKPQLLTVLREERFKARTLEVQAKHREWTAASASRGYDWSRNSPDKANAWTAYERATLQYQVGNSDLRAVYDAFVTLAALHKTEVRKRASGEVVCDYLEPDGTEWKHAADYRRLMEQADRIGLAQIREDLGDVEDVIDPLVKKPSGSNDKKAGAEARAYRIRHAREKAYRDLWLARKARELEDQ